MSTVLITSQSDLRFIVAAEVPPYRIVTVELRMNKYQSKPYGQVHRKFAGEIGEGEIIEVNLSVALNQPGLCQLWTMVESTKPSGQMCKPNLSRSFLTCSSM